jgi:5-methylcytosine-specific restriction enzyme subunit McrC
MARQKISLAEFETIRLPEDALTYDTGINLWRTFDQKSKKLRLSFPSPKTKQQWEITAQGWVGHIPLTLDTSLTIQPKAPLANIFQMWEYAYELRSFHLLPGLDEVDSLERFYERVVQLLVSAIQHREGDGLYKTYQVKSGQRPFVQGKLQIQKVFLNPVNPSFPCQFEEHTADVRENQILAYTLEQVARSRRCSPPLQTAVRRTTHHLQSFTTPHTFRPDECWTRPYTRLNQDYEPMHALCRFLLEHQGPTTTQGEAPMQPFLINMSRLYELFVAKWLEVHLPSPWKLKVQEVVTVGRDEALRFDIDLVLYDGDGRVQAILDTKYKTPDRASHVDINQVVTYAQAKSSRQAILIYPVDLAQPLDVQMNELHLRTMTFPISGDLDEAGQRFLNHLL